ncbi:MAG: hypothetical protein WC725_02080 [Patescibacteria group bacterium]|jgi:hypothetical protein
MKKFLEIFFITLGVIFFLIIIVGVYLFVADPYGIKPFIKTFTSPATSTTTKAGTTTTVKNPLINAQQEAALKAVGIDPAKLPTTITPAMEACFTAALGAQRVAEIKAGAAPTPVDMFKAKGCL